MKKTLSFTLIVLQLFSFSCKDNAPKNISETDKSKTTKTDEKTHNHWSYSGKEGPEYWSHLSEKYYSCNGSAQSPINISQNNLNKTKNQNTLQINYHNSEIDIINNGHTEEFLISKGNSITFNNKTYVLKQFHMHTPSEHTLDGNHLPLEVHFVNQAEDDTYAVISVMFKEGEASSFLKKYITYFPKNQGEYVSDEVLDVKHLLPDTHHFYHYKGSFTTPPCTEVVDWIILKDFPTASKEQIERLHQIMGDNFRPVQPLNNRVIEIQ